jgi:hypothetical protein
MNSKSATSMLVVGEEIGVFKHVYDFQIVAQ